MPKAVGYLRISEKDQSNWSLSDQKDIIIEYCRRSDIELIGLFEDDGQSAKNFDRRSWQQLEKFIEQNHRDIDYLIVKKYDRFSRNVAEALQVLDKIEKKYKIIVLSALEYIGLHPESPIFFYMRTQLLLNGNNELNIIKERTKAGLHQGAKMGRFLHMAPFGYKNARDGNNKPIIVVNEDKAAIVRRCFQLFLSGRSLEVIRKELKPDGLTMDGNSAMRRMLSNPTYAGMIKVPAYYNEQEKFVDGQHDAIIDKSTWYAAQSILSGRQNHKFDNEVVPLRGSLYCECGRMMTAGRSKGKNCHYWYYVCLTCKKNNSAIKLHNQFDDILTHFSFESHEIEFMEQQAIAVLKEDVKVNEDAVVQKRRDLRALEVKIDGLEEKYITGGIDDGTYRKWKTRYESERFLLNDEIDQLNMPIADVWARHSEHIYHLTNVKEIYNQADIYSKKSFISMVFDNKLYYKDGSYRTPYIDPLFALQTAPLKEKGLLMIEQSPNFNNNSFKVPQTGNLSNIIRFITWSKSIIKVA